jgi:hypothetical protein
VLPPTYTADETPPGDELRTTTMQATAWVGLASAGVAALAIIGSVYNTWMTTRSQQYLTTATFSHQRIMAIDERLWRSRSQLYVDLLQAAGDHVDWSAVRESIDKYVGPTRAFGSDEIVGIVDELLGLPDGFDVADYDRLWDQPVERVRHELGATGPMHRPPQA